MIFGLKLLIHFFISNMHLWSLTNTVCYLYAQVTYMLMLVMGFLSRHFWFNKQSEAFRLFLAYDTLGEIFKKSYKLNLYLIVLYLKWSEFPKSILNQIGKLTE